MESRSFFLVAHMCRDFRMNILHPFFGWVGLNLTSTQGALNDAHHSENHLVFVMLKKRVLNHK